MLAAIATLCSLQSPLPTRRAAVGAGLAAVLPVFPAMANNEGAAKYASGYVEPPKPSEVIAALKAEVYAPYAAALAKSDWKTVGSFYAPSATIVDGSTKGQPISFVKGDEAGKFLAGRSLSKAELLVSSIVFEGEFLETAHVSYTVEPAGQKAYAGLQKVVKAGGKWSIEEDVYPLESGKVYGMIKPQRNLLNGKVFMSLDPALKL